MPKFPEDLFEQIYRRAPTKADRARLIGVKAALGLSDRDELWPLILVFDHYCQTVEHARYALVYDIRNAIVKHANILKQAGALTDTQARRAVAEAISESAEKIAAISEAAIQSRADAISKSAMRRAALLGGALGVCLIGLTVAVTYSVMALNGVCEKPPIYSALSGAPFCEVKRLPFSA
jgi:hypothetical protein